MKARSIRELVSAVVLAVVVMTPALLVTVRAQGQQGGIPDLIGALKSTPGVLGVDAARGTMNGKTVIFAWFENKKAALAWYYSETHMAVMLQFSSGGRPPHTPMSDVPDDGRPILAIASLTMPGGIPAGGGDVRSAVTQIAIELYAPLPGGLAAGGRFAPSTVKVPGLVETPIDRGPAAQK